MNKPILCLDFDGVIHSYASGWKGADVIPDPPVPGALDFIRAATEKFRVAIFSSRSNQQGGIAAMQGWLIGHITEAQPEPAGGDYTATMEAFEFVEKTLEWPTEKPPAFLTIDDRAITFTGAWPDIENLLTFKPWNKPA